MQRYVKKRFKKIYTTDLGASLFVDDVFFWDTFQKQSNDGVGHLFQTRRIKKLRENHRSMLLEWLTFIDTP